MKSRIIYHGRHYTACAMRDGSLIVTRNGKQSGVHVEPDLATSWIDAIVTAVDQREAAAMCRAILNK